MRGVCSDLQEKWKASSQQLHRLEVWNGVGQERKDGWLSQVRRTGIEPELIGSKSLVSQGMRQRPSSPAAMKRGGKAIDC
jgi:hypothetical protein